MSKDNKDAAKQYGLTQSETELLLIIRQNTNAIFSATISQIASQRLAYQVTENTQFKLTPDLKNIEIMVLEPKTKATDQTTKDQNTGNNDEPIHAAK